MPFYIQMPQDEFFNTGYGWQVIEGIPRVHEPAPGLGPEIEVVTESFRKKWPTVLAIHGWVEVEGPARTFEYEEYKAYIADLINRDPRVADAGMAVLKDGTRVPIVIARLGLLALRSLLRDDPVGFYELVTATRNPAHQFFGNHVARLRERGLLDANDRPAGVLRSVILNAVEGEDFEMRLVTPERPQGACHE